MGTRFTICWLIAVTLGAASCHSPDNYLLSPDNVDQYLTVTMPETLRADGVDSAAITASITERSPAELSAEFTVTGGGTLVFQGAEGSKATVPLSSQNTATATLRSDAQPKHVTVQVKIGKITVTKTIEFVAVSSSSVFALTSSVAALPANGFSTARIQVALSPVGTVAQRKVLFATTGGTLSAAEATANEEGIAAVTLTSDVLPRTIVVTATAREHSQSISNPFTPVSPADLITLRASRAAAPADDDQIIRFTATVPRELVAAKKKVTFRTTRGVFQNNQTTYDEVPALNGELSADLRSSAAGPAIVSAAVEGAVVEAGVRFDTAQPTQIVVTAAAPTLEASAGETVQIRATLLRSTGKVTAGMFPIYAATRSDGTSIGTFTDLKASDAAGLSSAAFSVGTTPYRGPVTIRVSAPDSSASTTVIIEIVSP
jgi:hypothetical protein